MEKKGPKKKKGKMATKKVAGKTEKKKTAKKPPVKKKTVEKDKPKIEKKKTIKKPVKKATKKVKAEVKKKKVPKKVKVKAKAKRIKVKKEEKAKKKKVAVKEKKFSLKPEKKVKAKKVTKKLYPPLPVDILPEEYGEDSIALMTVDPRKLFIYWELREDTVARHKGILNIRIYDVTGVDFDGTNAHSYFDMSVNERIGNRYINVTPEREYVSDMGVIDLSGVFMPVARSNRVLTPREGIAEEGVLPHRLFETGLPVGYEM